MQTSRTSSIKEYSLKFALIILVVIFFVSVFHYLAYSQYLKGIQENEYKTSLSHISNNISRTVRFYQSFVDQVAAQTTVVDLLEFGTKAETQIWANNMQRLVPESIGLTLFNVSGQIKGLEGEFRLNKRCLEDMDKRFKNIPIAKPPVHSEIEELAHFDIVSPVTSGGENIGLVFISFSLDVVKRLLVGSNIINQKLTIITSDGFEIASAGSLENKEGDIFVVKQIIEGTDWVIELSVVDVEKNVLVTSLLLSNIIAFILLSLVLTVSMKKLFSMVIADFESLSWIMNSIKTGTYNPKKTKRVSLNETEHIMHFIQHTAKELYAYQEQLKHDGMTDELTGLYNRRALNIEIDNLLKMENKDLQPYLVIIDLDYFKEINDTYGHDVGDDVLKILAESLSKNSGSADICSRSGGDEFIVIFMDYDAHQVKLWYTRVVEHMNAEIQKYSAKNNIKISFGISAGCTLIRKDDMKSTVLKRADKALYKVKEHGRGNIEFL